MLQVYQPWDKLKTCIVGKPFSPQFFSYIKNPRVRNVLERITTETEEDFQELIKILEKFNVKVLRPNISENFQDYWDDKHKHYRSAPMTPRDWGGMFGNTFFFDEKLSMPAWTVDNTYAYKDILNFISENGNPIIKNTKITSAIVSRVGKDLYFGTWHDIQEIWENIKKPNWPQKIPNNFFLHYLYNKPLFLKTFIRKSRRKEYKEVIQKLFDKTLNDQLQYFLNSHRCHVFDSAGHIDGCFTPVVPGLIMSIPDYQDYSETFPGWEVVYCEKNSMSEKEYKLKFLATKSRGKWWVLGEEDNDEFTNFVEQFMPNWTGNSQETYFDLNMLVIDKKNVIVSGYSKKMFEAFNRWGITPHVVNLRHKYFFDGSIHCITCDLDREGEMEDYFPGRNQYHTEYHRDFDFLTEDSDEHL
jgi:hypothetical protein